MQLLREVSTGSAGNSYRESCDSRKQAQGWLPRFAIAQPDREPAVSRSTDALVRANLLRSPQGERPAREADSLSPSEGERVRVRGQVKTRRLERLSPSPQPSPPPRGRGGIARPSLGLFVYPTDSSGPETRGRGRPRSKGKSPRGKLLREVTEDVWPASDTSLSDRS